MREKYQELEKRYKLMEESKETIQKQRQAERAALAQQEGTSGEPIAARENEGSNSFVVVSDHQSASGNVHNESKVTTSLHKYEEPPKDISNNE